MFKIATATKIYCELGWVLGHHIDAKISPKTASEKAQTTVSENRYTSPKVDVFRTDILLLLATTENNEQVSFLVHQVLQYHLMFMQFSIRVSVSKYTCHPMIAKFV